MKSLLFLLVILCSVCLSAQQTPPRRFLLSAGIGLVPIDQSYRAKNLASEDGKVHIIHRSRTAPISVKAEYFWNEYFSTTILLNHYRYKVEWEANLLNWDTQQVLPHKVFQSDGRTTLVFRWNAASNTQKQGWYCGIGAGILLRDYYQSAVTPGMILWGRDSEAFRLAVECSGGYRIFPFKQARNIGFYTDIGLTQAFVQMGIVVRP